MGKASRARPKRLAEKLAAIRRGLGLTHDELIAKLECPDIPLYRASISQYENNKGEPPLPVLLRFARLAGVSLESIVDDELDLPAFITKIGDKQKN